MLIWLNRILRLCPGPLETLPQYDVKDDETRQAEYVEHVWRDAGHRGPSHTSGRIQVISRCSRPAPDNRVLAFYAHLERSAASLSHYYYFFFLYNSPSKHAGVNLEMYSFANYLLEMSRVTSFCWGGKLITLSAYKKTLSCGVRTPIRAVFVRHYLKTSLIVDVIKLNIKVTQ